MDTPRWAQALIAEFPNLRGEDFEIVGGPSGQYNCVAYAADDITKPWDPGRNRYWPPWATRTNSIDSLKEVFYGLDYTECADSHLEDGHQKVALYENAGIAQHVTLQMPTGRWRSKMGNGPLIEHARPESLAGGMYGEPTVVMRRAAATIG